MPAKRSAQQIRELILQIAREDTRILAVILNGSRANPAAKKDAFQDFDILFLVKELESFRKDENWIDQFGERIILQKPNEMVIPAPENNNRLAYLMLFKDWNRIDLTLMKLENYLNQENFDSLSMVLLDKKEKLPKLPTSSEKDYLIQEPSEKAFQDCCNEFWWLVPYVVKGLHRAEITYAKAIFEGSFRNMLMQMLEWYMGSKTNFKLSFGKHGRNIKDHLPPELWKRLMATYPDSDAQNIWKALFLAIELFREMALFVAEDLQFEYNIEEDENVIEYLIAWFSKKN